MSRYVPVSTKMDSEDHYHSPYDTNDLDSDVSFCCFNIYFLGLIFSLTSGSLRGTELPEAKSLGQPFHPLW